MEGKGQKPKPSEGQPRGLENHLEPPGRVIVPPGNTSCATQFSEFLMKCLVVMNTRQTTCRDSGFLPRNVCIAWRHGFYYQVPAQYRLVLQDCEVQCRFGVLSGYFTDPSGVRDFEQGMKVHETRLYELHNGNESVEVLCERGFMVTGIGAMIGPCEIEFQALDDNTEAEFLFALDVRGLQGFSDTLKIDLLECSLSCGSE
ncbi:hypothetical protein DEO72_LG10g2796 [Vigna unguiculata]|uniref:Uncharacterized protein n=1 Tax=Vigna unguiculata TaxID=3917 RepID=A0A4D6NCK3_VIGUN|nr:hypothetical protein DEO72_LG10g2796 [Vigna unguiculata]